MNIDLRPWRPVIALERGVSKGGGVYNPQWRGNIYGYITPLHLEKEKKRVRVEESDERRGNILNPAASHGADLCNGRFLSISTQPGSESHQRRSVAYIKAPETSTGTMKTMSESTRVFLFVFQPITVQVEGQVRGELCGGLYESRRQVSEST